MSDKNRIVSISKSRVFPVNGQKEYSYKYGNPVIQFEISPDEMKMVDTKSMRFNFLIDLLYNDGNNVVRPNNFDYKALGQGDKTDISFSSRVGVNAIIENLRLMNFQNEVIEEIRGYGRLLASTIPALTSFEAYKNSASCVNLATGQNDAQLRYVNGQLACSIKLRAGLLNSGQPLDLNALGGLKINIQLAPDSLALASDEDTAYYLLSSCSLTYNGLQMEAPIQPSNIAMQYPAYSSFVNIIQSSDDTQSLMMNKSSVRACFSNYIKTSELNNLEYNSMATNRLADTNTEKKRIKNIVHLRNNVKFPKYYDIDERKVVEVASNQSAGAYEAELGRGYLDCFVPFNQISSCLQSPFTQGFKTIDDIDYDKPDDDYVGGTGSNYDQLGIGSGAEFKNSQYSVRIQSELTDGTANTVTTFSLSNEGLRSKNQSVEPIM